MGAGGRTGAGSGLVVGEGPEDAGSLGPGLVRLSAKGTGCRGRGQRLLP